MASNYSLSCDSQMMQNHLPAALIDAENGFVGVAGQGATFLFSVDSQNNLWILAECPAQQGKQWAMQNVTAELQAIVPNGTVTSVYAASASGGALLNALVVVQDSTNSDHLIALAGAVATPAAIQTGGWMSGPSYRTWTSLIFDAKSLPAGDFSPLTILSAALTSGITITDGGTEYPVAAVVVQTSGQTQTATTFGVSLPPSQGGANLSPAWTYYIMAAECQTLPGYLPGRMEHYNPTPGAYELGIQANGDAVLNFVPFTGGTVTPFHNVDQTASAIAALPYIGADSTVYTDLYVASNKTITLFSWNDSLNQPVATPLSSDIFSEISALHALTAGDMVLLWGVNKVTTGEITLQQLFWLSAPMAGRFEAGNWSTPTIALGNVSRVSPLTPDSTGTIDLFVSAPVGQGRATVRPHHGARSSQTADFLRITRTPDTGTWTSTGVTIPAATDYTTISTYTDRIVLTDVNSLPCPNETVQITASANASVLVNGKQTQFIAGTAQPVATDSSGVVAIVHPVSSYAGVSFTVSSPDGSTTTTIDPSTNVKAALLQKLPPKPTAQDLANLTYPDGNGGNPLVFSSDNQLSTLASLMQPVINSLSTLQSRAQLQARGIRVQSRDDGFLDDLFGDVAQLISTAVTDIETVTVDVTKDVITLIVNLAGEVYNTTIECLDDAITAVSSFFQAVAQDFEAVYNWLAYVFDWNEMVAVHNVISDARQQSFIALLGGVGNLKNAINSDLNAAIGTIKAWTPLEPSWGSNSLGQQMATYISGGATVNGVTPSSNSMVGWISQRLNDIAQSQSSGATQATASNDSSPFLDNLASQTGTLISGVAADVLQGFTALIANQPAGPAIDTMIESVGAEFLQWVENMVDDFFDEIANVTAATLQTGMNQPIDLPILSSLYNDVTGSTLTLLDAACLLEGVLLTVIYNIANPNTSTTPAQYIANLGTIMTNAVNTATGVSAVLGDSDKDVAEYYGGVILLYKSLYNVLEYLAVSLEATELAGVFGGLGALADVTKAILELVVEGDDAPPGNTGFLFFSFIALMASLVFQPAKGETGFDQALALNAGLNMWLGFGQAVVIWQSDGSAADWCECVANLLDFPNIALAKNPTYGLPVAVARSAAYAYTGITMMNGD